MIQVHSENLVGVDSEPINYCNPVVQQYKLGQGPWTDEPDFRIFKYEGFYCLIVRMIGGAHFSVYVLLPEDHPLNRMPVDKNGNLNIGVYTPRPINFSEPIKELLDFHNISLPSELENSWAVGISFCECFDYTPGYAAGVSGQRASRYKDIEYVSAQVRELVDAILLADHNLLKLKALKQELGEAEFMKRVAQVFVD